MKRDGNRGRIWSFFNGINFSCSCFELKHFSLVKMKLQMLLDSPQSPTGLLESFC